MTTTQKQIALWLTTWSRHVLGTEIAVVFVRFLSADHPNADDQAWFANDTISLNLHKFPPAWVEEPLPGQWAYVWAHEMAHRVVGHSDPAGMLNETGRLFGLLLQKALTRPDVFQTQYPPCT